MRRGRNRDGDEIDAAQRRQNQRRAAVHSRRTTTSKTVMTAMVMEAAPMAFDWEARVGEFRMGNAGNGSLIPKPPLGNQTPIFDSQIVVGSTKMNLIPLLILASKHGNDFDSGFPFLNPARKPSSSAGIRFLELLEKDEMAFDNLYCVAFRMMDAQWLAKRASYMEFNDVLKSTRAQLILERELKLEDVSCVRDLPAHNLLHRSIGR
ncbi:hypothetical protein WN944_019544 [Citrus x changshan-huyou]|uniref:ELMO domain-containing protein n=1 Tax=Citrus x changshan-huyou TaxID=2935761 RepID=A0AAP0M038_9ROSI